MQNRVIENVGVGYYNSHDHDTTLVNVAAGNGVCLSPGFLKGDDPGYSWVPFDCPERFDCGICLREKENREPVLRFVEILKDAYSEYNGFLRYGCRSRRIRIRKSSGGSDSPFSIIPSTRTTPFSSA